MVEHIDEVQLSKFVGYALLATIIIGLISAFTIATGIDVNMTADINATAEHMLQAEQPLRAKAYISALICMLELFIGIGLFMLLRKAGPALALWSMMLTICASLLGVLSSVFAMNAATIVSNDAFTSLVTDDQKIVLLSVQAMSDYTSFHIAIVLASIAKAGFFSLFLRLRGIPYLLAAWGIFASLFVAFTIVARDFIPVLGSNVITAAFMLSNMIALVGLGLYLSIWVYDSKHLRRQSILKLYVFVLSTCHRTDSLAVAPLVFGS